MTTASLHLVVGSLRHLACADVGRALTDAELLHRFTAEHDEAAFAAIVQRYGRLVLSVCRRVLRHEQDAEDAFQATFLVLARKADSVRRGQALSGWLHGVAFHVSMKARRAATRRQTHEKRAPQPAPDPPPDPSWRELQKILEEEVNGLPETYRAPFVLCCLDGRTKAEAAHLLGWKEGTVSGRLARARKQLGQRLARRGISLSAVLAALALAPSARAQVATGLLQNTVRAGLLIAAGRGTGEVVGISVAALADGAVKTLFTARARALAVLLVLGLVGVAAAGLGYQARPAAEANAAATPPNAEPPPHKASTGPATPPTGKPQLRAEAPRGDAVTGRVLDENGAPVAGGDVGLVGEPWPGEDGASLRENPVLARSRTDRDGRFRLPLARSLAVYQKVYVLAAAEGHGPDWQEYHGGKDGQVTLRLTAEKVVTGRVLDLQGQPVAGVRLEVSWLGKHVPDAVSDDRFGDLASAAFPLWPGPAMSNAQGRFIIRRLSPTLEAAIFARDDRFAFHWLYVRPDGKHTGRVSVSLAPAQVIEGQVTYADTGKPVAHARVWANEDQNTATPRASGSGVRGRADAGGRFRLNPPTGKLFTVSAQAPAGQPYLSFHRTFAWSKGRVKHHIDLALPRGVLLRGKIVETVSGQPVPGATLIYRPRNGELNNTLRDGVDVAWMAPVTARPDGTFRMTVLPGRGHLLVKSASNDYIAAEVSNAGLDGAKGTSHALYPDAVLAFDLKPAAGPQDITVRLRRGVTVSGRLLTPEGKPVRHAIMLCWNQVNQYLMHGGSVPGEVKGGRFELPGCDPKATYRVFFLDAAHALGAVALLSARRAGSQPVSVILSPCGAANLRLVNKDGKPIKGFMPMFQMTLRVGRRVVNGSVAADAAWVEILDPRHYPRGNVRTDDEGRLKLPCLIPGATYHVYGYGSGQVREFKVEPGQKVALPDLPVYEN